MRIAYLITKSEFGGAQSHLLELMASFCRSHEVSLGVGSSGWLADQAHDLGIPVMIIPNLVHPIHPRADIRACMEVGEWLDKERPDILHTHSSKAGLIGRIVARKKGVRTIFTAHGWAFTPGTSKLRKLISIPSEWVATRFGGEIICVSEFDRDLALRYFIAPKSRLHTIWNGIQDDSHRARPGEGVMPIIAMVARFAPQKDYATLLNAMHKLVDLPWRLWLIGEGPLLTDMKELAAKLGIDKRIDFLGARADVPLLLAKCDLFVLASRFEGLPISILEAMRAGLPVIASSVGGVSESISPDTGRLVTPRDPSLLARELRQLLSDSGVMRIMGRRARNRYEADFTASRMIKNVLSIYRSIVETQKEK